MKRSELTAIRGSINDFVGMPVELLCLNRKRLYRSTGVLECAYPSVFTVIVDTDEGARRVSYTYADVLTKAITVKALKAKQHTAAVSGV